MKKLLLLLLAGVLSQAVYARGSTEDTQAAGGPVTVRAYVLQDDRPFAEMAYERLQASNPDISVEFLTQDYFAGEQLIVQLAGRADVDVIPIGNNAGYVEYVSKGLLAPLNGYVERDNIDVSQYGTYWTGRTIDGLNYDLPTRGSSWVLYYNKNLFDNAGVPYPSGDMTWEQFRALARRMTSGEGNDKIWGTYIHRWPICTFGPALQTGASIIDEDLSAVERAIQLHYDIQSDGSTLSYADGAATNAHYRAMFTRGNVAMHVMGEWHIAQLRQDADIIDFEWDITTIPHPEGVAPGVSWGMGAGFGIVSYSRNADAAWELIREIAGPAGQPAIAAGGFLAAYRSPETRAAFLSGAEAGLPPTNLGVVLEQRNYLEYPAIENINIIVGTIYREEIELVLLGEQSAAEAIQNVKRRIAEEL